MMVGFRAALLFAFLSRCFAAKFVMFPMFGRSHYMILDKLGQELSERGHEVILFVGATAKYATNNPYVRFFNDSQTFSVHTPASGNRKTPLTLREEFTVLLTAQLSYCDEMLSNVELMKETYDADLVVGELWYLCSALVADKLSVPHVLISPATLSTPYTFALGLPAPLAYVPQINNDANKMSNIIDRGKNVLQWISLYWYYLQDLCSLYGKVKAKYNITSNKSIQETLGRADLIIGQMPFGLEHPRPVHPNTRVVGPFLPSPAKPLPKELEEFVGKAGDEGVIVVSFGSVLGDTAGLNGSLLQGMADAFSKLPQKIIWKMKLEGKLQVSVSDNVKLMSWLPQNDILGHPKTRLFICHAGLNGILESTYHGVPMILTPFFGDQFYNANTMKQSGVGEVVNLWSMSSEEFVSLIRKVLGDPSYRKMAKGISNSVKLLPRPPVKEAADWVEYTLALDGLPFLRPRGLDLPFYQLYLLDILLLAFFILFLTVFALRFLLKTVINLLLAPDVKEKAS